MSSNSLVSQPPCNVETSGCITSFTQPRANLTSGLWRTLILWRERAAQRAHLATLDDRMLKDIGITCVEAKREAAKPFWWA